MARKKYWIIGAIIVLLALILCAVYHSTMRNNLERENECFSVLYNKVRDIDFTTGDLENGTLTLYDADGKQLTVIDAGNYHSTGRVMLRKDIQERQIYFVLGGSVDDEYGVLYTERNSVNMNGLWSIKRLGGNSFYYQTYE